MLNKSFSNVNFFKKAMDASWLKNQAIANNMANVNTPGYKRETVNFEEALKSAMDQNGAIQIRKTDSAHMDLNNPIEPKIDKVTDTSFRMDDNNVDIDVEMAELSKNQLQYNALTNQLNAQLQRLRSVISGGR